MGFRDARRGFLSGVAYFAVVFAAGFVLGTLRVFVLVPKLGEFVPVMLELPFILFVSWVACRWIIRATQLEPTIGHRSIMGVTAFGLLMVAEIGVSTLGFGRTISEHFAHYSTLLAQLGLAGQVMFAAFPIIQRQ